MAGTINLALTQQFDMNGDPLAGGKLYFFAAGTTTPQSAFQDVALTIAHPNPIILDASGRIPMFYLADGNIKIRLADISDVTIIAADQLLVVGPSVPATAIPPPPDPSAQLATGDIKARYGIGSLTGFVRCNGGSIGKSGSAATERPNDDTSSLFQYLWTFANITLNGPKTTPSGDFAAGKLLNLPDLRGRGIVGMDDMGAAAAGRLTATYFGAGASNPSGNANGVTLGNAGGNEKHTLTNAELAPHIHVVEGDSFPGDVDHTHSYGGTTTGQSAPHTHPISPTALQASGNAGTLGPSNNLGTAAITATLQNSSDHTHDFSGTTTGINVNHKHHISIFTDNGVGVTGVPHNVTHPCMVLTFYIKL